MSPRRSSCGFGGESFRAAHHRSAPSAPRLSRRRARRRPRALRAIAARSDSAPRARASQSARLSSSRAGSARLDHRVRGDDRDAVGANDRGIVPIQRTMRPPRGSSAERSPIRCVRSAVAVDDPGAVQVVRREFDANAVARQIRIRKRASCPTCPSTMCRCRASRETSHSKASTTRPRTRSCLPLALTPA